MNESDCHLFEQRHQVTEKSFIPTIDAHHYNNCDLQFYPSMKVRVQLIENNPLQRVPSVFINLPRTQLLFNPIPSLLRHRKLHKINLYNSSHIFFTKNSIQSFGGLPNYLLFRSGAQNSDKVIANKLYLYGDTQMINYLQKLRFKLGYKSLRFSFTNWSLSKYRLGVSSLSLFNRLKQDPRLPQIFIKIEDYLRKYCSFKDYFDSRYYISRQKSKYIDIECPHFHANLVDIYPIVNNCEGMTLTNYLCMFPEYKKGVDVNLQKFSHEAKETRQAKIKQFLDKGVFTKDGKNYKKEDYIFQKDYKPSSILIFHYASVTSVEYLLSNPILHNYFKNNNQTGLIVHIVEHKTILQSQIFKKFIRQFQDEPRHLWFCNSLHRLTEKEAHNLEENILIQKCWNDAFPNIIKNIHSQRIKDSNPLQQKTKEYFFPIKASFIYKRLFSYVKNQLLGDKFEERKEAIPKTSVIEILSSIIDKKRQQIQTLNQLTPKRANTSWQPKVTFLGTNSSMPTINRNTSGILISLNQKSNILLDCGEETYQQIVNHFSVGQVGDEILKVRLIFISHIHSDHNLGILNLISERQRLLKQRNLEERLFLIIPFNVYNWYASYNQIIEDLSVSCDILFTQILLSESYDSQISRQALTLKGSQRVAPSNSCNLNNFEDRFFSELEISSKTKQLVNKELPNQARILKEFNLLLQSNNITKFQPVRVIHCPQSFGIVIQDNRYKVSYSGDTRPSQSFQQASKNSDLIIHEATFNDQQATKAKRFKHSTVEEAVKLACDSKSKTLALTHFKSNFRTPLYLKNLPRYQEYFKNNTIISLDHLEIPLGDHQHLPVVSKFISRINDEVGQIYEDQNCKGSGQR